TLSLPAAEPRLLPKSGTLPEADRRALADRPWIAAIVAFAVNVALFGSFLSFAAICYESNDDTALMQIANGVETGRPSEYLVFTNILIGRALRWLYEHYPAANWYSLYLFSLHFAAMTSLLWCFLRLETVRIALCFYFLIFVGFEARMLMNFQFTSTAIMTGWAGAMLLLTAESRYRPRSFPLAVPFGTLLLMASAAVREQAFILVVCLSTPLVLAAWLRRPSRRLILWSGIAIGFSLLLLMYHRWEYRRDPQWREFVAYNAMRGRMQDFPVVDFADNTRFFFRRVGWNDVDYYAFRNFFAVSDQTASPETLARVLDLFGSAQGQRKVWDDNLHGHLYFFRGQVMLTLSVLAIVLTLASRRWVQIAPAAFAQLSVVAALFVYLGIYGKLEHRVTIPTLACLSIAFVMIHATSRERPLPERLAGIVDRWRFPQKLFRAWQVSIVGISAAAVYIITAQYSLTHNNNRISNLAFQHTFQEIVDHNAQANPKPVYVVWKRQMPFLWDYVFSVRPELLQLSMIRLGWNVHSPLLAGLLAKHQVTDIYQAILDRPEFLLMSSEEDTSFLKGYLRQHYGVNVVSSAPRYYVYEHAEPVGPRMIVMRKLRVDGSSDDPAPPTTPGEQP
ncbi:MAG: hypothetical protein AB7O26_14280, partial [Planctomycetaceae bacterium]